MTELRASDVFDIPLGAVMKKIDVPPRFNNQYIFVGWALSKEGKVAVLVQNPEGVRVGYQFLWHYTCATAAKILEKFPEVEQYRMETDV